LVTPHRRSQATGRTQGRLWPHFTVLFIFFSRQVFPKKHEARVKSCSVCTASRIRYTPCTQHSRLDSILYSRLPTLACLLVSSQAGSSGTRAVFPLPRSPCCAAREKGLTGAANAMCAAALAFSTRTPLAPYNQASSSPSGERIKCVEKVRFAD
jgi:hypothetical protein